MIAELLSAVRIARQWQGRSGHAPTEAEREITLLSNAFNLLLGAIPNIVRETKDNAIVFASTGEKPEPCKHEWVPLNFEIREGTSTHYHAVDLCLLCWSERPQQDTRLVLTADQEWP